MTRRQAVFILIAGLFIGTVFIFGEEYWRGKVSQEETIQATAAFSSYKEHRRRGNVDRITVSFQDYRNLDIEGVCITEELRSRLSHITPGTVFSLMIHPHSDFIMDMRQESAAPLLDFQEVSKRTANEVKGFLVMGLFFYAAAFGGFITVVKRKKF